MFGQYGAPDPLSVGTGTAGNTVVGASAGSFQMTGNNNSFFGTGNGFQVENGSDNTLIGTGTGTRITTGNGNTFLGVQTGRMNDDGSANVFLGRGAGEANVSGSNNTFVGESAGTFFLGNRNISIGSFSGPITTTTISDRLFIDVEQSGDPLIYGEFDNDFVKINGTFEVTAGLSNPSDVNLKNNFSQINESEILNKIGELTIQQWTYKHRPEEVHIGTTAQEFYSAFGLGSDDKHIHTIDANGVALAAIKALKKRNDSLINQLNSQEILIKNLFERLERLEDKDE